MTEFTIAAESNIATVTANTAFHGLDADSTGRVKKVLASQIGAYVGSSVPQIAITQSSGALVKGITVDQSGVTGAPVAADFPATANNGFAYNYIRIRSDNIDLSNVSPSQVNGLTIQLEPAGASCKGNRAAIEANLFLQSPGVGSQGQASENYIAFSGVVQSNTSLGGTNLSAGAKGSLFGAGITAIAAAGATNLNNVTGGEIDVACLAGSSTSHKSGWSISSNPNDAVQGANYDGALSISCQTASVGWKVAILFSDYNGQQPLSASGTLLKTQGASTVTGGADFTSYTFTGNAFASNNFTVDGSGNLKANTLGIAVKPTVTGSRGANAALASLLTALASIGLITDSTS